MSEGDVNISSDESNVASQIAMARASTKPSYRGLLRDSLNIKITNSVMGRKRREGKYEGKEINNTGPLATAGTDACGNKIYSEHFVRKNHRVYPMEKLKKALEEVRVTAPTLSNSIYKGFAKPGEKETAQFFKNSQACSFYEIMRAIIQ